MKNLVHFLKQFTKFLIGVFVIAGIIFPFTPNTGPVGYTTVAIDTGIVIAIVGGLIIMGSGYGGIKVDDAYEPNDSLRSAYDEIRAKNESSHIGMELFYAGIASAFIAYQLQTLIA